MASVSKVSICNLALTKLGADRITSLDDNVKAAKVLNEVYDEVLESVLTDHSWSFALKRVALTLLDYTPIFEYTLAYQKPTDCLKIIGTDDSVAKFKLENERILSNTADLKILYIFRQEDSGTYFMKFVEALATKLASYIAYNIVASRTLAVDLLKEYKTVMLPEAIASDSQNSSPTEPMQDEWINGRETGPTPYDDVSSLPLSS